MSFDGSDVFNADITLFENATTGKNYVDMNRVDALFKLQTGCMKVIFLNRFVQDLLVCFHFILLEVAELCSADCSFSVHVSIYLFVSTSAT